MRGGYFTFTKKKMSHGDTDGAEKTKMGRDAPAATRVKGNTNKHQ